MSRWRANISGCDASVLICRFFEQMGFGILRDEMLVDIQQGVEEGAIYFIRRFRLLTPSFAVDYPMPPLPIWALDGPPSGAARAGFEMIMAIAINDAIPTRVHRYHEFFIWINLIVATC